MSKKKKGKKPFQASPDRDGGLSKKILDIFKSQPEKSFDFKIILEKLKIEDTKTRNKVIRLLGQLTAKGQLKNVEDKKFQFDGLEDFHTGIIDMTSRGDAYVVVEDMEQDIYISNKNLNHALDGDEVKVYVFKKREKSKSEGEVVSILTRAKTDFVGVLHKQEKFGFVVVANSKMYTDIFVPNDKMHDAEDGLLVKVRILQWKDKDDSPKGEITEVLGVPGEHNTEMHAILAGYGLPEQFPPEVEEFANGIDTKIHPAEIKKRRDLRDTLTFTIDPADAKDFDDALSFKKMDNGNFEIGIHIADVAHYLQPGTILDDEAYNRATSIYLVDRVVPMLPEVLSNGACSLRPNEEKYTFSALFELTPKGEVKSEWFGRTVTYSDARFAYEEAQYIIDSEDKHIPADVSLTKKDYEVQPDIVDALVTLNRLAKTMRQKRMQQGAISFDKVEVKFHLDADNNPQGVYVKTSQDANKLIEEFMLLANRKVSEFIGKRKPPKTFVYRCHDEPKDDRLEALNTVISKFGYSINIQNKKNIASALNSLLEDVKGKKEQNLVDTLTIRTMSKAYYSTQNIGHYGLAFDYYSHFTSPIRRYPDVMAHRLLQRYLDNEQSASETEYEDKCKHSSEMEKLATNAERDSIKYMQVKYIQDQAETEFKGVISGVTDFGIFIEIIENKCEGMTRLKDISDDHYDFNEEHYAIIGRRTKKMYQLGDEVYVRVKKADLVKRTIDFELLGSVEEVAIEKE
ncbi:ribonuclease R [Psychroflexus montanilacus]|uniref:ribonuclease R n=1 Tax=Psychroflexus montanilacus TaxID=2873598 RepID=UPI001CCD0401|nr:ribonuclease R [Psychroflexus montanilacus]MBZ9652837.1 ribonuclease R [Psychroflexus montanilacus]